jgi:hypothetical protein
MIPAFLDCESRLSTNEMFDLLLVFSEKVAYIDFWRGLGPFSEV